jgi:hypothetical protein
MGEDEGVEATAQALYDRCRECSALKTPAWKHTDDDTRLYWRAMAEVAADILRTSPARVFEDRMTALADRWDGIANDATPRGDHDLSMEKAAECFGYAGGLHAAAVELRAMIRAIPSPTGTGKEKE